MKTRPWVVRRARRHASVLALALVVAATATVASGALAQTGTEARIVSLKQAFDAAWQRQPEARSADARRQAAESQRAVARSWTPEPMALELSAKTDHLTGNHGNREYVAGVAAPLWLPGERSRAQAVAQAEAGAVDTRLAAARWRVAGTVREAWWAVQRSGVESTLAQARLDNAQQLAADVTRRVRAGDLSPVDRLQAEAAVAAAQSALAEARSAQAQSRQALRSLTGAEPAEILPIAGEASIGGAGAEPGPEHPALRELVARSELARRARELASIQTRANPELTIAATRDRGAFSEPYGQSLSVGIRIPFGSDDRQRARLATAGAEQTEAESQLEVERSRVAADIATAQARLDATRLMAEAADKRATAALETRRILQHSFRLGETDLPTRLRVELEAYEAERQRERSRIDMAHATSQWRQAVGLLPE